MTRARGDRNRPPTRQVTQVTPDPVARHLPGAGQQLRLAGVENSHMTSPGPAIEVRDLRRSSGAPPRCNESREDTNDS